MAAGNHASDDKAGQGAGYQIGELEIAPAAKRSPSQELSPVAGPATHSASGVQPKGTAEQAQLRARQQQLEAQARAHAQAEAQARAQQQAQALQRAQAHAAAVAAQAQAAAQRGVSQGALQPAQAQLAQARAAPANTQTNPQREKGLGQQNALEDVASEGAPALEIDLDAVRVPKKGSAPSAKTAGSAATAPKAPQPAAPPVDFSAFGSKDIGGGFDDHANEGPALELEQIDRSKGDRVSITNKGGADPVKAEANKEEQLTRDLAGYGPDPENIREAVTYAVHVARRLMALKQGKKKAVHEVNGLEADHNTALVEMGQALMAMATDAKVQPLRTKIAAVHDAQAKVTSADRTISKTREENQQAMLALEKEIADSKTALLPFTEAEQRADQAHKKAEEELKRGQGLVRRVEIELRALTEAKTPPNPAKLAEVEAQLEQRQSTVVGLEAQVAQAAQALGQSRRELAMRRGTLDALEDKKKTAVEAAKEREAEVEQHAKAAEGTHAAALRALAENCIEQRLTELVEERHEWVKEVEGVLGDARKVVKRYDRALVLYDRPSVIKGWAVLGGLAVGFMAALVFLLGAS